MKHRFFSLSCALRVEYRFSLQSGDAHNGTEILSSGTIRIGHRFSPHSGALRMELTFSPQLWGPSGWSINSFLFQGTQKIEHRFLFSQWDPQDGTYFISSWVLEGGTLVFSFRELSGWNTVFPLSEEVPEDEIQILSSVWDLSMGHRFSFHRHRDPLMGHRICSSAEMQDLNIYFS